MDKDALTAYVRRMWPAAAEAYGTGLVELRPGRCLFQRVATDADERPGGTLRGPLMMEAADQAAYALVLGHLGDAALAVTSNLSIDFLRRPPIGTLLVDMRLRKFGRTQITMTGEMHVDQVDPDKPVAITTVSYSQALLA